MIIVAISLAAGRTILTALFLTSLAWPADGQQGDTVAFSPARADALTGLYVLEDGRLVHVMDLRSQMGAAGLHDRMVEWVLRAVGKGPRGPQER
jgi:hypothetical protein